MSAVDKIMKVLGLVKKEEITHLKLVKSAYDKPDCLVVDMLESPEKRITEEDFENNLSVPAIVISITH